VVKTPWRISLPGMAARPGLRMRSFVIYRLPAATHVVPRSTVRPFGDNFATSAFNSAFADAR